MNRTSFLAAGAILLTMATTVHAQDALTAIPREYGGTDKTWMIDCFQSGQKIISERDLSLEKLPATSQSGQAWGFFTRDGRRVSIETSATSVCIVKEM